MAVVRAYIEDGYVGKKGEAPVYVSFYIAREKIVIPCKLSIPVKAWDKDVGKVTTRDKFHADRNMMIDNVKKRMNDIFVKYRLANKKLTKDVFLNEYHHPTDFHTFFDFAAWYQKLRFKEIEKSTAKYHEVVIKKLKNYKENLTFDDITSDFIREYFIYLKKTLRNNDVTSNKNLIVFKIYVNQAVKRGYMTYNPFEDVKIKRKRTASASYLTEEELSRLTSLYSQKTLPVNQQKTLGFFLFMCFSSLHIGDAKMVKMEQISNTTLTYYRKKNRNSKPEPIFIPLSKPAKKIIKQEAGLRVKGLLFDGMYSGQYVKKLLKKIAERDDVKINKKISAKTGRHTFATIYLRRTKDIRSLQELLGHSNISETLLYAHVLDESKREGINTFNNFKV